MSDAPEGTSPIRRAETDTASTASTDVMVPLSTLCDAVSLPGELLRDLYEEALSADNPVAHAHRDRHPDDGPHLRPDDLVAVVDEGGFGADEDHGHHRGPFPALTSIASMLRGEDLPAAEARDADRGPAATGEGHPLLHMHPARPPLASPPGRGGGSSRRLHVRDVSLDLSATVVGGGAIQLEAIPERKRVEDASPRSHPPNPPLEDEEEAGKPAQGGDRSSLLDALLERAGSYRRAPAPPPPPPPAWHDSLRQVLHSPGRTRLGSPSFRRLTPPRVYTGVEGEHAEFVLLDTTPRLQPHEAAAAGDGAGGDGLKPRGGGHERVPSLLPAALLPLEQGLERGLSILPGGEATLPSDVCEVKLEIDKAPDGEVDVHLVVKRTVPAVGYLLLALACFAMSSTGAAMQLQGGVTPTLKAYWRMTATVMVLFPFAVRSVLRDGGLPKLTGEEWRLFVWCGLGYAVAAELFVLALSMTSITNAYIFSNSHCLLLVVLKALSGVPIACREGLGATIGFLGGVVCALDGAGGHAGHAAVESGVDAASNGGEGAITEHRALESAPPPHPILGDALALVGAAGTVAYLTVAKRLRPLVDLFVYMFLQLGIGSIWILAFMVARGDTLTLDSDPRTGLWGWATPLPDRLPVELWLVLVCNLTGLVGYVAVMKYFEPIVVSCAMNLQPVLASVIAVTMGVEDLPGLVTMLGDVIVFGGTYMVISSEAKSTQVMDVKEAARERGYSVAE